MTELNDQQEANGEEMQGGLRRAGTSVMSGATDAADVVRATAEAARARLPEAVAGAQVAARDTHKVLKAMPNQALIMGTSFSLGMAVGLFVSGANRLLVALALAPAAAMALTMFGRNDDQSAGSSSGRRSKGGAGQ